MNEATAFIENSTESNRVNPRNYDHEKWYDAECKRLGVKVGSIRPSELTGVASELEIMAKVRNLLCDLRDNQARQRVWLILTTPCR